MIDCVPWWRLQCLHTDSEHSPARKYHSPHAHTNPTSQLPQPKPAAEVAATAVVDDDVDPLDAFMATNQKRGAEETAKKAATPVENATREGERACARARRTQSKQ